MTTWYAISATHHSHGFCQCDRHEEVQRMLNPEAKSYRDQYPVRMVFELIRLHNICGIVNTRDEAVQAFEKSPQA